MARKVFISVLGTSFYEKCKYVSDNFVSEETSFIQHATLQYLKVNEWTEDSKVYILLTQKARKDNWCIPTGIRHNYKSHKDELYKGLEDILTEMHLPCDVVPISIPDGKDENEMWAIFETTFNLLEEGDELYYDLTHSFRYLPMLMLVLGNYAKFLKHVKVTSITYGNYEARDEDNKAPIVDLLPLSSLQDWTFATADFLKNGFADRFVEMTNIGLAPLLRSDETRTVDVQMLNQLFKNIDSFTSEIQTCRGMQVVESKTADTIKNIIHELNEITIPQITPVLDKIISSINVFSKSAQINNMFNAAKWCYDRNLYQQCTTFLEEGVISFFCSRHQIPLDCKDKRELITSAFTIIANNISQDNWRVSPEDLSVLQNVIEDINGNYPNTVSPMNTLVQLRNDYNHCGMRENRIRKVKGIQNSIKMRLDEIFSLFYPSTDIQSADKKKRFIINLSNHPSGIWETKQLDAAEEYGEITDIPFPSISPDDSEEKILLLADEYVTKVMELAKDADVTVHVMGEMTFTYALVFRLKSLGIQCVASTTDRNVTMDGDGHKLSEFSFVKFREY